eukprot:1311314-Rhodomonas_salina.1
MYLNRSILYQLVSVAVPGPKGRKVSLREGRVRAQPRLDEEERRGRGRDPIRGWQGPAEERADACAWRLRAEIPLSAVAGYAEGRRDKERRAMQGERGRRGRGGGEPSGAVMEIAGRESMKRRWGLTGL